MTHKVWETIRPIAKEYKRNDKSHKSNSRTYYVLESGLWTNVLIDRIAQHKKNIICTWSFKHAKVYINGQNYIKTLMLKNVLAVEKMCMLAVSKELKISLLKKELISKSGAKMFEETKGRDISENAIRAGQCRNRQADKLSYSPLCVGVPKRILRIWAINS